MLLVGKLIKQINYLMLIISGFILISMMCVTLADIITRSLFKASDGTIDLTFIGGVEYVKYGLLLSILFSLPYSVGKSQVVVDLFTEKLSVKIKSIMDGVFMLGFFLLGTAMAYRFYRGMIQSLNYGETTQDLLLPLFYFYGISAFACAMLSVSALTVALKLIILHKSEHN
jgi:TRAP-type C4-dicarboxylate transport system permease small subunit